MTAEEAIYIEIHKQIEQADYELKGYEWPEVVDEHNIHEVVCNLKNDEVGQDIWNDHMSEFRSSGTPSGIPSSNNSRHYECEELVTRLSDGNWVGWTFWHGGGKHGEPEAIDWVDGAYFVDVKEELHTAYVRVFTSKDTGKSGTPVLYDESSN